MVETRTQGIDDSEDQLIRYQHGNHIGSVCIELDGQATIISYEEYYPYGSASYQAMCGQTETPKRYRFVGKERDEETGLNYHGARYYAVWLGKWISSDLLNAEGSVLDSSYCYVNSQPINFTDSTGLSNDDDETAGEMLSAAYGTVQRHAQSYLQAIATINPVTAPVLLMHSLASFGRRMVSAVQEAEQAPNALEATSAIVRGLSPVVDRIFHLECDMILPQTPNYDPLHGIQAAVIATERRIVFDERLDRSTANRIAAESATDVVITVVVAGVTSVIGASGTAASTESLAVEPAQAIRPALHQASLQPAWVTEGTSNLTRRLVEATTTRAQRLISENTPNRGPVLTGVIDLITGRIFFGLNRGIPANLHRLLRERLRASLDRYAAGETEPRAAMPGAHSEINAINEALWYRENRGMPVTEGTLSELLIHNIYLRGNRAGTPVPRCSNCLELTGRTQATSSVRAEENVFHGFEIIW